jgi:hypothetical protein
MVKVSAEVVVSLRVRWFEQLGGEIRGLRANKSVSVTIIVGQGKVPTEELADGQR